MIVLILNNAVLAKAPDTGDKAPDFSLTTVQNETISLSGLKGKVVLMGMFHICVPCMHQAMEFEKVRQVLPTDKLAIIGINTFGDSKEKVMKYLGAFPTPVSFPYCLDPETKVDGAYIQRDMPTVVIIGPDGVIRARSPGVGADQLIPYLKKML
ncbi:MAG: TlpA disulfide reductase family protein [Nitrospinota bacterium]|nr:TlpA disulfide reductase family protein [Nitrospinota bacterium]